MRASSDSLARLRNAEFSIDELVAVAGRELRRLALRPSDGRVTAAPDERAVRFYQGAGLLDRPIRYDGRRAVYTYRHLLQLLAVKRLQEEGRPLALVQRALAGRTSEQLEGALSTVASTAADPAPAPPVPPATAIRALVAAEVTPGVTVTIDPARVARPDECLAQLTALIRKTMEDAR